MKNHKITFRISEDNLRKLNRLTIEKSKTKSKILNDILGNYISETYNLTEYISLHKEKLQNKIDKTNTYEDIATTEIISFRISEKRYKDITKWIGIEPKNLNSFIKKVILEFLSTYY